MAAVLREARSGPISLIVMSDTLTPKNSHDLLNVFIGYPDFPPGVFDLAGLETAGNGDALPRILKG